MNVTKLLFKETKILSVFKQAFYLQYHLRKAILHWGNGIIIFRIPRAPFSDSLSKQILSKPV